MAFIDELYPDCVFRCPSIGEVRGAALQTIHEVGNRSLSRWPVEDQVAPVRMRAPPVRGFRPYDQVDVNGMVRALVTSLDPTSILGRRIAFRPAQEIVLSFAM
jgi:hypothetical protein